MAAPYSFGQEASALAERLRDGGRAGQMALTDLRVRISPMDWST